MNLFQGDTETLDRFYPKIGWSIIARQLVHNHARKLLEKESRTTNSETTADDIATLSSSIDVDLGPVLDDDSGPDDDDFLDNAADRAATKLG